MPDAVLNPMVASTFAAPQEAAVEALRVLDEVPPHMRCGGIYIWQFADREGVEQDKRSRWTWRAAVNFEVGGYMNARRRAEDDRREMDDRRMGVLGALAKATESAAEAVSSDAEPTL